MAPARTTKSGEANLRSIAARGVVKRLKAEVSAILLSCEAISNYRIYLGKLPGLDKKARVAFDWTLDLLFRKDVCAVHNLPPRADFQRRAHRQAMVENNGQYRRTAEIEATLHGVNP